MDLIVVTIVTAVAGLSALVIFWLQIGKPDKRSWIQVLILTLLAVLMGAIAWLLRNMGELPLGWVYVIMQVAFLCMGLLHNSMLYRQMWSVRDTDYWERDSLANETAFTIFVSQFQILGFMSVYFLLKKETGAEVANFWALFIPFLIPFSTLKILDLLNQVPIKDYSQKWTYQLSELDETRWQWDNTIVVGFQVVDAFQNENNWFPKRAHFMIRAPRNQLLTQVYRLGLRVYHEKNPTIPVQDIGYEVSPPPFWWLFYIKFHLFKPQTWFPKERYLDPNFSLENNGLQNNTLVTARRMPFY